MSRMRQPLLAGLLLLAGHSAWALDLKQSIEHIYRVSPELRAQQASILASENQIRQAGLWPNTELEIKTRLDGQSSEIELAQPLPIGGRLGRQKELAQAELSVERAGLQRTRLQLEYETARRFHKLQLTQAQLELVERHLALSRRIQELGRTRSRASNLSQLGRLDQRVQLRLSLLEEQLHQQEETAKGEYEDALARFAAWMERPRDAIEVVKMNTLPPAPAKLDPDPPHPLLEWAAQRETASQAQVELSRSERIRDLQLGIYQQQNALSGDAIGLRLSMPLPLWNRNQGAIGRDRARLLQTREQNRAHLRDWRSERQTVYEHLIHLREQARHHANKVLHPAESIYELSYNSFQAGELGLLEFLDALHTYFEAQRRQMELRHMAWLEAAELRHLNGRFLASIE